MSPEGVEPCVQAARGVTRRSFLKVGSIGVAAAGMASVVPGVGAALGLASAETPELTDLGAGTGAQQTLPAPPPVMAERWSCT